MPHIDTSRLSRIARLKEKSDIVLVDRRPAPKQQNVGWIEGQNALLLVDSPVTAILQVGADQTPTPIQPPGTDYTFSVSGTTVYITFRRVPPLSLYIPLTVRVAVQAPRRLTTIMESNIIFIFPADQNL